jgi:predicted HTH transcriptional regulator
MADDQKYILELIAEGEHQQQDFKFEITSARKIAKTLVAFANTDGGRLLIGVKDNGKISGVKTDEEYYMIEAAASMYCKPEISFQSFNRIVEGKTVLEVKIKASEKKPHFAEDDTGKWLAYYRVKDNNYLANYIQLQLWKRAKREFGTFISYTDKEKEILKVLFQHGPMELMELKIETSLRKKILEQILINLISLGAVSMEFRENIILFRLTVQNVYL